MNINKSSTTSISTQHKRCVSFNSMVEVCYLESSSASNEEETIDPSELWWTARESKRIKGRCRSAVRHKLYQCGTNDGSDDDDESDCSFDYRGLERLLDAGKARALITNAVRAVIREQARQQLDGDFEDSSDLFLARVYRARCTHSKMKAERLGFLDAREAMAALLSEWVTLSPTLSSLEPEQPVVAEEEESSSSSSSTKEETTENITDSSIAGRQRQPKSIRCHSSERVPFQENLKFTLTNVMTRRRCAWI
jgi:hypothetical protein